MLVHSNSISQKAPNFKAKIRFSQNAYNKLPLSNLYHQGKYIGKPWLITDSKLLDEGYSDLASACTMGFIKSQGAKEGYFFHCAPSSNPFERVKAEIIPVIQKFQEIGKPIEGILTGANLKIESSLEQAKNFMGLFDNFDIQYSAFLAQRPYENPFNNMFRTDCPRVDMFVSAPKNEYIIGSKNEPMFIKHQMHLKDRFIILKKAPQDEIIFE